jgi:hypothetical protein
MATEKFPPAPDSLLAGFPPEAVRYIRHLERLVQQLSQVIDDSIARMPMSKIDDMTYRDKYLD